ncbi:Flavin-containing monooxygenase [Aphelenchoides besseyi]|nr:Flavin-containing monooxygenase [Aphelenchoides besseyi]
MVVKRTTKRVCILGAGAAGLCAARHCQDHGYDVTVFEQLSDCGGTWLYSPKPNSFSSLYEKMFTNIPKEVMSLEHLELTTDSGHYLKRYAKPIRHLIKFNTTVTKINRQDAQWLVTVKPSKSSNDQTNGVLSEQITSAEIYRFDLLFICNGHFSTPRIPLFASQLTIPWIHCHNYKRPDEYVGKEVAIVGAGPSGVDVAIQISKVARKVHLLYNMKVKYGLPENVVINANVISVFNGRSLLLGNGEQLDNLDAVVFCTGYKYEVPFCQSDLLEVKSDNWYVSPLYEHCIHVRYPTSLFVIGKCWFLIPFVCFDQQVKYALALADGSSPVPSQEELESFEENRLKELKLNGDPIGYFHRLGPDQWKYFDHLAKLANQPPLKPVIRKIFDNVHEQRTKDLATFKSFRYRILDSENFEVQPFVDLDCY